MSYNENIKGFLFDCRIRKLSERTVKGYIKILSKRKKVHHMPITAIINKYMMKYIR